MAFGINSSGTGSRSRNSTSAFFTQTLYCQSWREYPRVRSAVGNTTQTIACQCQGPSSRTSSRCVAEGLRPLISSVSGDVMSVVKYSQPPDHPIANWMGHFALHVIVPVFLGTAIYLLFRTTNLLVFDWLGAIHLTEFVSSARQFVSAVRLPDWLLYSLPDGLWLYAITCWMILIWNRQPPLPWLLCGLALGLGGELGQALAFVPGTYQHLDMFFYITAFLLALFQLEP